MKKLLCKCNPKLPDSDLFTINVKKNSIECTCYNCFTTYVLKLELITPKKNKS